MDLVRFERERFERDPERPGANFCAKFPAPAFPSAADQRARRRQRRRHARAYAVVSRAIAAGDCWKRSTRPDRTRPAAAFRGAVRNPAESGFPRLRRTHRQRHAFGGDQSPCCLRASEPREADRYVRRRSRGSLRPHGGDAGAGRRAGYQPRRLDLRADRRPHVSPACEATLVWMHERPLQPGADVLLQQGTTLVNARVNEIVHRIDPETMAAKPASQLGLNKIGLVRLETARPLVFEVSRQPPNRLIHSHRSHRKLNARRRHGGPDGRGKAPE